MSTSVVLFNGLGSNDEPGLWVTDGTAAGTSELSVELSTGLNPQFITNFNGKALFAGADPSSTGDGLWVTDGTAAGTSEIGGPGSTGISEANFDGLQPGYFQVYKGEALFRGAAGLAGGEVFGLWVTNGTAAGTSEIGGNKNVGIKNADSGGLLKDPPDFTPFNGKVLFRGWDNKGEVGLWVTNGTAAGTSELPRSPVRPLAQRRRRPGSTFSLSIWRCLAIRCSSTAPTKRIPQDLCGLRTAPSRAQLKSAGRATKVSKTCRSQIRRAIFPMVSSLTI